MPMLLANSTKLGNEVVGDPVRGPIRAQSGCDWFCDCKQFDKMPGAPGD